MRNMILFFLIFIFTAYQSAIAFTVILKSGKVIEGTWLDETSSTIRLKDKDGTYLTFNKQSLDLKAMSNQSRARAKSKDQNQDSTSAVQETVTTIDPRPKLPEDTIVDPNPVPKPLSKDVTPRNYSFNLSVANVFDSNINHDQDDIDSVGLIYGVGVRWINQIERPSFEVDYSIAKHAYTDTDEWDRISHNFNASYERRIKSGLSIETDAQISIKGSLEDREIGNQYLLKPQLKYRINKSNRIILYVAHRWKRYEDDQDRNAINQYAGGIFEHRFGDHRFEAGYRYERNNSEGLRNKYIRWTYHGAYTMPIGERNWLSFEIKYRPQNYTDRLVEIEVDNGPDFEELRQDKRWIFSVDSEFELSQHFSLLPSYTFEKRTSNDIEKFFKAHMPTVALRYEW